MSVEFTALRPFPLSYNGIDTKMIQRGQVLNDIPTGLINGLEAEDFIVEGRHDLDKLRAPENKDAGPAPETSDPVSDEDTPPSNEDAKVEIPADWQSLEWNALRSLAASVSDTPIGSKDAAFDAISAYLEKSAE